MKCKFIVPFLQDGSGVYWKKFLRRSRKKSWGNSANNWEQKSSLPWQKFASSSLSDDVSTRIWWQLREIGVANELFWGSSLKKSFIVEKSFASKSLFDLTWKPPPYEKLKTKKKSKTIPIFFFFAIEETSFSCYFPNYSLWQIFSRFYLYLTGIRKFNSFSDNLISYWK